MSRYSRYAVMHGDWRDSRIDVWCVLMHRSQAEASVLEKSLLAGTGRCA